MIIKGEPYNRDKEKISNEKSKAIKLWQIEKRINSLQLSNEELNNLFLKTSFSTV